MSRDSWEPVLQGMSFPEGPAVFRGTVACVDVRAGAVWTVRNGEASRIEIGGRPNGAAFNAGGALIVADSGHRALLRIELPGGLVETLWDEDLRGPNDLLVEGDAITFTDPGDSGTVNRTGRVLRLTFERTQILADGLAFPNGIARHADGTLLVAETKTGRILNLEDTRIKPIAEKLQNPDGSGGPDGLTTLPDGGFAAAVFGMGHIVVLGPDAAIRGFMPVPGSRPTNLCHDGSRLYCTEVDTGALWSCPLEKVWEAKH